MSNLYNPKFVEDLFDRMSGSYELMNYYSSFGFSDKWRKQFVNEIDIKKSKLTIVDLMSGMGECWKFILPKIGEDSTLIALDFSSEMVNKSKKRKEKHSNKKIEILEENVFKNSIKTNIADIVYSGFGLKTFNEEQLNLLAEEIKRILKTNGRFSLIDVSVPENKILKILYLFYLKNVIPLIGKLFLSNPETYKMLGVYTNNFKNSIKTKEIFENHGLHVEYIEYFYGCATGIKGLKKE
ncbi:class I SAM-dependent methyltransferase [Pontimicrobium aquaticum]|uniref:Methyltransferase domain-containing protein n=1 Tax=Pontimicrobium aquaticum TaxID=2565367 RepID=A0A4U0F077_9FLAO|nr:class I SAM-dependent methyltransferase [Pontimicrobium aquaticum]TJY37743.1 methyltransferase domain-containing protein [Pontimicrobium aquaticum]